MTINVNIGNATVKNLVKVFYTLQLNDLRKAEIYTDGSDLTLQAEYTTEKTVKIYRNGTLEFEGEVFETENFQGGGVILYAIGQEIELMETECPIDSGKKSKTWVSTSDNTIFNDIVTNATGWSTDTSGSTGATLDSFKVTESMSVWEGVIKFKKATNKDFYINDSTKTVYLVDNKNRTNKAVFNEGQNCGNIRFRKKKPKASKVVVYGKGDGDNQIIGSHGSGTPVKKIIDRTVLTENEANNLAAKELALIQNSIYHYRFNAYNPNEDVETGDTVVFNAPSAGFFNSSVDIVKIKRGLINDKETLSLEVTDTNHRVASENLSQTMFKIKRNYEESQSSMQGSGNTMTFSGQINANDTYPLKLGFFLPSSFIEDETGDLRVNSFTLDYDVDEYRKSVGSASDSGHDHNNPEQTSTNNISTQSETISDFSTGSQFDISDDSWYTIDSFSFDGTEGYSALHVHIDVHNDIGTSCYYYVRVETGSSSYYPRSAGAIARVEGNGSSSIDFQVPVQAFSGTSASFDIEVRGNLAIGADLDFYCHNYWIPGHTHSVTSWDTDEDYAIVSIGDGVDDSETLNATELSEIKLYHYNTGTSTWDLKHTITNTGKTLDTEVDLSDGGTYPDDTGFWKVEIKTDASSPDLIKAIVKLKHNLDN